MRQTISALAMLATVACTVSANATIFAPGDSIFGGISDGTSFSVGDTGFTADANEFPTNEGPEHLIDGVGQKYLNFAGDVSPAGALITPSSGSSVANSITFFTANDAEPRDPASFELYGTNAAITVANPGDSMLLTAFTLIVADAIALPSSRNLGGASPLDAANSLTIGFTNTDSFTSYLLLFPTIKDAANANSMQLAEVQLESLLVTSPEPSVLGLFALGLMGAFMRKRSG